MLLGFSGKALTGKDTTADYLLANHGWDKKVGFAYNLKEACSSIFEMDIEVFTTQEGKGKLLCRPEIVSAYTVQQVVLWMRKSHRIAVDNVDYTRFLGKVLRTPREILQFVGTELMRSYANNYHVDVVINNLSSYENVVIPDVRFENEANGIINSGGYVVRLERPLNLRKECGLVVDTNHSSETSLDGWGKWSYKIHNNGREVASLYRKVDEMISKLGIKHD